MQPLKIRYAYLYNTETENLSSIFSKLVHREGCWSTLIAPSNLENTAQVPFRISKKSQFQTANYVPEMYGVPPLHIVYASQFGHLSLDFCLLGMEYPDP